MNQNSKKHISVLASETIKKLNLKKEGIYVDATLGMGGHSKMIAPNVNKLIVFDQDINAINQAKLNLSEFTNITFVHDNFSNMKARIEEMGISKVDGILFDLGTSFYQLTDPDRGFTYHGETTLDMRMNQSQELDAKIVLNEYSEEDLANIFWWYGEEKKSRTLAAKIVEARKLKHFETNKDLNKVIDTLKSFNKDKHRYKNIYQAIRIEVNHEFESLEKSLTESLCLIGINGVIAVITFHSLEDKLVKQVFYKAKQEKLETLFETKHKYSTKKTVYPKSEEIEANPAARSSKLRTLIKNYE